MARVFLAAWFFAGCAAGIQPEPADDLSGFHAPLKPGPEVRLLFEGSVEGEPADVQLDLASPMTTVSLGCFDTPPESRAQVRVPNPNGEVTAMLQVPLRAARLGNLRLGTRDVALDASEPKRCELTLGTDVLAHYAVRIDPLAREVRLDRPKERAAYVAEVSASGEQSPDEVHLIDLTRDPTADWPLVTARLRQGKAEMVGPFVVSTRESHTLVSDPAAHRAGLTPGPDLLAELAATQGAAALPPSLLAPGYPLDGLELSPGFGFKWLAVAADRKWSNAGAVGMVGSDVWGRFVATFDIQAEVLLLKRPRVFSSGDHQRCVSPNGTSEEACFRLQSTQPAGHPVDVVGVVWRDLPEGARIYLEGRGANGEPLRLICRVGLTFDKSDRGVSTQHELPWEGLQKVLPHCAEELHHVASYTMELVEEGSLPECPGECAFVQDLASNRPPLCECAPQVWGGSTDAERRSLQIYRRLLERMRGHAPIDGPDEPEPED